MAKLKEKKAANVLHNGIVSLDHPVIAVRDMESAHEVFLRLGFTIPPRGSHVEWGTGNWCIMFPENYLELRGIIDADRSLLGLDKFIEDRGEGLMGVALGTGNAENSRNQLVRNGIGIRKFTSLTRNFEHPNAWTQPRFDLCFPIEGDVTGLMHVVLCEHKTPELLRYPAILKHDNDAVSVVEITGAVDDLESVELCQKRLLGEAAVTRYDDEIALVVPSGQRVRLLLTEKFVEEYRGSAPMDLPQRPYLGAITFRVTDLARTRAALQTGLIKYETINLAKRLRVPALHACGTVLDFVTV